MTQLENSQILSDLKSILSAYKFNFDYNSDQNFEISKNESSRDRFTINLYNTSKKQSGRQKIVATAKTFDRIVNRKVLGSLIDHKVCVREDNFLQSHKVKRPMAEFMHLYDEHNKACAKMVETTKVLKIIDQGCGGWPERLEAEKLLLVSSVSEKLILDKIRDDFEYHYENEEDSSGNLEISKFQFHLSEPISPQSKLIKFYLLLVIHDTDVKSSQIVRANNDAIVVNETFVFKIRKPFEIQLQLYSIAMRDQKKLNHIYSSLKKSARTKPMIGLLFKNPNTGDVEEKTSYKSQFQLVGKTVVTSVKPPLNIERHFIMSSDPQMKSSVKFDLKFTELSEGDIPRSGFLNFGLLKGEIVSWERCWCILRRNKFKVYRYPTDETPFLDLDLKKCVSSSAQRCFRPKSFSFDMKSGNGEEIIKYFVRAESQFEFKSWQEDFNLSLTNSK